MPPIFLLEDNAADAELTERALARHDIDVAIGVADRRRRFIGLAQSA